MDSYEPVPVEFARQIGQQCKKQVVVIVAWDETYGRIHTTTWGEAARHKEWAAELGPILASAAGGLPELKNNYEDFRNPGEAARNARMLEICKGALEDIKGHGVTLPAEVEVDLTDGEKHYYQLGLDRQRRLAIAALDMVASTQPTTQATQPTTRTTP